MHRHSGVAFVEEPNSVDFEAVAASTQMQVGTESVEALGSREEWKLACRIAASRGFFRSELLKRFLLDVCEQGLLGRTQEITEQRIGMRIFGRPPGYDPGEDNIVRSYARMLRKRLDAYFAEEGAAEPLRLTIPRGGYVPVFEPVRGATELAGQPSLPVDLMQQGDTFPASEPTASSSQPWLNYRSAALGLLCGVAVALMAWAMMQAANARGRTSSAHALWVQLFVKDRNTLIVPADSGLGILENLTRHLVNVEDYANGSYLSDFQIPAGLNDREFNDLRRQHYTSLVDLDIATRLTKLPEVLPTRTQVRYARSITAEDLQNSNVILLGSKHSDPWVSLFEKKLNFKLEFTPLADESYVLNEHPIGTEEKLYRNATDQTPGPTYGVVAYLPEPGGVGHALVIEGLNMAATQAAADTLFNPNLIEPVLRQAQLPDGSLRPFEYLIETTSIGAAAPGSQIIATRIHAQ